MKIIKSSYPVVKIFILLFIKLSSSFFLSDVSHNFTVNAGAFALRG